MFLLLFLFLKDAVRCSGTYSLLGRYRALTMSVFGIVENFVAALYAGTRGILSGFFIILVVPVFVCAPFFRAQLRSLIRQRISSAALVV